ncbi:hypothetical protein AA0111_g1032 [Alternaria arborescens]|uniref:hypothetical protein n=1 Tax=Alternaria arborescens TaxID=156630 RepID=UPI00107524E3|nr:hypothetical protein AA0111_g1032 [Alternaria arborescens]RYO41105.1 hypothetical protein AA0111_g1032 [Alternaria arborescens]
MSTTRYTPIRSWNASSLYGTTSVFASQSELEAAEGDNDFGISQGISLADLESAERYMYNMPCTPPPLNLEDTELLNTDALLDSDKVLITKFYPEIAKIHVDTCNTCNRT